VLRSCARGARPDSGAPETEARWWGPETDIGDRGAEPDGHSQR